MNKGGSIGIAVLIIAAIIGIAYVMSSSVTSESNLPIVEEDKPLIVEEDKPLIVEEDKPEGNSFSVELTEKMGMKSP